jgi:geranylgeranyl diphosphate synthase type II
MVDASGRVEIVLTAALAHAGAPGAPPSLVAAMQHAVFPGGARIRPRLCLAVAAACGDPDPALSDAAAAAIELLHCASLVHDDMPCFDDSSLRRGRPSVHHQFGPALALLAGDALIVQGFETLSRAGAASTALGPLVLILASCSGMPGGIVGGQGWECEPCVDLAAYQRAKTGALFAAATMAGAAACGQPHEPWRVLGERLGEAYQVADDLADTLSAPAEIGKPIGRDQTLGRPNAALQLGATGALKRLETLVAEAIAALPPCHDPDALRRLVLIEVRRLLPKDTVLRAA